MNLTMLRKYIIFSLIVCAITAARLYADDFDDLWNQDITDVIDSSEFHLVKAVSNEDIADALIDLGAIDILQHNIYLRTNPLNQRSLLDYPEFLPQREHYNHCWVFGGQLFWNQMSRAFFDDDSSNISSYLAIRESDILDKLNDSEIKTIFTNFDVDPVALLPLFYTITTQQRRLGLMLQVERGTDRCSYRFIIPFYYLERNFFMTECEQEAIEQQLGKASNEDAERFARSHLISDQLGFGDSRFYADIDIFDRDYFHAQLGLQVTLPTAFAVAQGLLGRQFQKITERPFFSFSQLFELGNGNNQSKAMAQLLAQQFTLCALDALAENLLEVGLGNNKHLGIGIYLQTRAELCTLINRPWAEQFFFKNRLSFDYYFPAHEVRNFIENNDLQGFEGLGLLRDAATIKAEIAADPAYAQQVVTFLENQFVDRLFPFPFTTLVCPGVVLHSTSRLMYEAKRGGLHFGADTWLKSRERLRDICVVPAGPQRPPNIDVPVATVPLAYQLKLIGSVYYKVVRPQREWTLALNGDATVLSSGIGKDFTVSLNLEVNF
jgi:hypothetical protein